jgi:hypothetical protein
MGNPSLNEGRTKAWLAEYALSFAVPNWGPITLTELPISEAIFPTSLDSASSPQPAMASPQFLT